MEIQAILISDNVCVGSTFSISGQHPRPGDTVIFGKLVSGFVTIARDDRMVVDIRTAIIECLPARDAVKSSSNTWKVSSVAAACFMT